MKQGKKSFQHESLQDTKMLQELLNSVTKGIAKGELKFSDEEDEIVMYPKGLMNLKVTANQDDNRQRVTFRITWQLGDDKKIHKKILKIK